MGRFNRSNTTIESGVGVKSANFSPLKLTPAKFKLRGRPRKLALVIAAHDEEMFIVETIRSAIAAGCSSRDIYVVDDGSTDNTRQLVMNELGRENVISTLQKGKTLALKALLQRKELTNKYEWIHFADADTLFGPNYFIHIKRKMTKKYAAVTGYIKSMPGTKTSEYRVYEYTWGMEVVRRFQSVFGLIIIIPGPSYCIRSRVLEQLDMNSGTLTEDFDWTLQIHRNNLGKIGSVPQAVVYTQDPGTIGDYTKQITRWYRGIFQVAKLRKLGLKGRKEDWYFLYQVLQILASFGLFFVLAPASVIITRSFNHISWLFLVDFAYLASTVLLAGLTANRVDIIANLPHFYLMRWLSVMIFVRSFIEVIIIRNHKPQNLAWSTAERRYRIA